MASPDPAGASGDDFYDDPPNRHARASRGGGWFATAALMVGCAMLGTVGAFGYRTYAKPSSSPQAAPVIIADSSPSKVLPTAADQKSTRSQERVPAQGSNERLVSREEQPVALPSGGGSPPRVVFPSPVQPAPSAPPPAAAPPPSPVTSAPAAAPAPAAGTPTAASTEPKRVRTVTIRNDRSDASGRPVTTQSAREQGALPPSRNARTAAPRAEPSSRGEPLSLDPAAQAQAREPVRPQQRVALSPPAPRESAPPPSARQTWEPAPRESAPAPRETASNGPRLASAPANGSNGNGGGYLVQVSSQRSQADAQSSYRGLQAKYPQLKSRQATIRRADLGSKGVYYRAMVGPFGSAGEAGQFCNSLKQAGGQCIILRN